MTRAHTTNTPGYHGRYLRVDVSRGAGQWAPLDEAVLRNYLGGAGLGVWLLLAEGGASADPFAPAAPIAFVFSPLVGSPVTTSAKFAVVSRGALSLRINDSLASSGFALAGKKTGADAIVLVGRAAVPSILIVDDGQVRLEPADTLWGRTIDETERLLRERLGTDFKTAVIGPAGERRVRFATISHDGRHAGRGGGGAVLGAKNIKAVAVRGAQICRWADPTRLAQLAQDISKRSFGPATAKYRELGTASNLLLFNRLGTLPTRNFQRGSFDGAESLAPEQLSLTRGKVRSGCVACTIGCEHIYSLGAHGGEMDSGGSQSGESPSGASHRGQSQSGDSHNGASSDGVRLEYENLFALGPLCGISDADSVLRASRRCDELGMDTISAGGTIAFAMECVERGLLDAPWLAFGDSAALLRAIDLIGSREDLGDRLAEGSRLLACRIGHGAIDFAPQVKGLEIPGYEPRTLQSMALGFAVGARGADHNRSGAYEVDFSDRVDRRNVAPEEVRYAIETEDRAAVMDSLILCKFLRGVFDDFYAESAEMLRLVTGWEVTSDELRATARRIVDTKKHFNTLAGWTPAEDTLPTRFLKEKLPRDAQGSLSREHLSALVREYNLLRGWTADGYLIEQSKAELAQFQGGI